MRSMSDPEFALLQGLIHRETGIQLSAGKKAMLAARLAPRAAELKCSTFREYYLRANVKPGGFSPKKELGFVTKEQATAAMQKGRMTVGDADHLFDLECRAGS